MHRENEDGATVTHLSQVEARGGSRTRATRNVLIISLFLIVVALCIALATGYFHTSQTGADQVNANATAPTSAPAR